MGFFKADSPSIEYESWRLGSRSERLRPLVRHIAERGMGNPDVLYVVYAVKIGLFVLGAACFALATKGIDGWSNIGWWWSEPIVFQKVVLWSLLFEVLGLGCGFGPLTGKIKPPMGSVLYWLRAGTLRLPPWSRWIPFTGGDRRTLFEVLLYAGLLVATVYALCSDGTGPVPALNTTVGLLPIWNIVLILTLLAVVSLRDKLIFLACRGEVYGALTVTFLLPGVDMIVAAKLVMVAIWIGAATSKLNKHFPYVVATMMGNSPLIRSRWLRKSLYRHYPDDVRPSIIPRLLAHGGTAIEMGVPLALFFSQGGTVTVVAAIVMVIFHLVILTAIPLGVPLEWNVFMIFGIGSLFVAHAGLGLGDLEHPWIVAALMAVIVAAIVVGNLHPPAVSFLPGMRYYAGNWDISTWCLTESATNKIHAQRIGLGMLQHKQLERLVGPENAETSMHRGLAFRAMYAHGRAVVTLLNRVMPPGREDDYAVVEGEMVAAYALGWSFGDGHLHNENLVRALQKRCQFEPGEVRIIIIDGQPIHRQRQQYRLVDAATGEFERGTFDVADLVVRQPWEDDVPVTVMSPTGGRAQAQG
ncbi:hypothetical protein BST36_02700 [Mycolicibacterium moriokaense]|uniref:Membrane protein n=1 Tax=Mycolicibacterium moriokaense TaxID=39691 RepID=A0AAD1HFS4_9MYCO|nr:DUF3556 domain-containing protein [Mycolicibacterium moriokaense]MCV7039328.1 DUF3556 domain-containing protein [Mycolicibacterium moriokaense]ORB26837.1 hypothetical protein BST36_02700 [Mycolicibacterium moriokaense]BBX03849.1 membrane protein [Mycolicibacterium moriokaense]